MHTIELLTEATTLAERLGYQIRQEWLGGNGGGCCEVKGRKYLFLDLALGPREHLDQLLDTLRGEQRNQLGQVSRQLQEMLQGNSEFGSGNSEKSGEA